MALVELSLDSSIPAVVLTNNRPPGAISSFWSQAGGSSASWSGNGYSLDWTASSVYINDYSVTPGSHKFRAYYMIPSGSWPSTNQAFGLIQCTPWLTMGFWLYSDGSVWYGYASDFNDIHSKSQSGASWTQVAAPGTLSAGNPFRIDVAQHGGSSKAAIFTGANLETLVPSAEITSPASSLFYDYPSGSWTPQLFLWRINTTNGQHVSGTEIYIDSIAYDTAPTDGNYIGPYNAGGPQTITAAASLSATATLGATASVPSVVTASASLSSTATLSQDAEVGNAAAALFAWSYMTTYPQNPDQTASVSLNATSTLSFSPTWVDYDISQYITGVAGPYSLGWIQIPQNRVDMRVGMTVSTANCQGLDTWGISVNLPKPLTPNEPHSLIIDYKIRDWHRRVMIDYTRAHYGGSDFNGQRVFDTIGKVRVDGFMVEPGPGVSDSTVTYRWSVEDQMWWIDSWSGAIQVFDHRPNEAPDGYAPLYFSEYVRAEPNWPAIRDGHINALKAIPYWLQRFMLENNYVNDIVSWSNSHPGGYGSLIYEGLGFRNQMNPASYASANGTSSMPVSVSKWWLKSVHGVSDGRVMLHEMGHLVDYTGLVFAGHPYGVDNYYHNNVNFPKTPETGEVIISYHEPPYEAVVKQKWILDPVWATYIEYDTSGIIYIWQQYDKQDIMYHRLSLENTIKDLYDAVPAKNDGNYYKSTIGEWIAQMIGLYFMRRMPDFDPVAEFYGSYYVPTTQAIEQDFNAYLVSVDVFPALDALQAFSTLTIGPVVERAAQIGTLSATSSLSVDATVVVPAEVTLDATSSLGADALRDAIAVPSLAATSETTVDAIVEHAVSTVDLSSSATLGSSATTTTFGSPTLSADATLTVGAGSEALVSDLLLTASSTLSLTADTLTPTTLADAALLSVATLTATADTDAPPPPDGSIYASVTATGSFIGVKRAQTPIHNHVAMLALLGGRLFEQHDPPIVYYPRIRILGQPMTYDPADFADLDYPDPFSR